MNVSIRENGTLLGGFKSPFPRNLWTALTYVETVVLTSTTGSLSANTWNLNSCYDPNSTGVGHKPRYFDTLCGADGGSTPYRRYRVHKTGIEVLFDSNTTSVSRGGGWAQIIQDSSAAATWDLAKEEPEAMTCKLPTLGAGSASTRVLRRELEVAKCFGAKDLQDDLTTSGPYNANPGQLVQLVTRYQDLLAGNSVVSCTVKFTFYVQFFELNNVAQS